MKCIHSFKIKTVKKIWKIIIKALHRHQVNRKAVFQTNSQQITPEGNIKKAIKLIIFF